VAIETGIDLQRRGFEGVLAVAANYRRIILILFALGLVLGAAIGFVQPTLYKATTTFIPSSAFGAGDGMDMGSISMAASRLGVNVGQGQDPSSLFPWILRSRELSSRILNRQYLDQDGTSRRLGEMLHDGGSDSTRSFAQAMEKLHGAVFFHRFHRSSGVTEISIRLENPKMAAAVANDFVHELDEFYRGMRQSRAVGQVEFVTGRLKDVEIDLKESEKALAEFKASNRLSGGSPQLILRESRLSRAMELNQQLYLTLNSQLELARIQAADEMPAIVLLDPASIPTRPYSPRPVKLVVLFGILGLVAGLVFALARNFVLLVGNASDSGREGSEVA
jgi:uncharacterized protein involved in exopolysaccharide biosynthesis